MSSQRAFMLGTQKRGTCPVCGQNAPFTYGGRPTYAHRRGKVHQQALAVKRKAKP